MTHAFDGLLAADLRHADSLKWNLYPEDVLPLWIADMDFPVAPAILDALHARLSRSIGYGREQGGEALLHQLSARYLVGGEPLGPEGALILPGVVPGLYAAVLALTAPGDEVLTHAPIYPPFLSAIHTYGRLPRMVELRRDPQQWSIDWDAMEAAVSPASRVFMLCSPHNPTGRVWTREELERLADFALRHRLWVVSDELHADLVLEGEFISLASLGPEIAARTITLTGPCKAFNTAGLGIGMAYSANASLIQRLRAVSAGLMSGPSTLATEMWRAALSGGQDWLRNVLEYLRGNRDFLAGALAAQVPQVVFVPPQATYLAWLDFRAFPWAAGAHAFLLERAHVGLNDGPPFGPQYEGFLRLNFATPRPLLEEAVRRIAAAVN